MDRLFICIPNLILSMGIVGNTVNILIFAKEHMRSSPTLRFLLYLSIADLIVLIMGISEVLLKSDYSLGLRDSSLFVCNIQKFVSYSSTYVSSCLTVAVNVYRAKIISNLSHLNRKMIQTKRVRFKRALNQTNSLIDNVTKLIIIFVCVINIHFILLLRPSHLVTFDNDSTFLIVNNETNMNNIPLQFRKRPRTLLAFNAYHQKVGLFRYRSNSIKTAAYNLSSSTQRFVSLKQQNQTTNLNSLNNDYNHDVFKCLPWQNSFYEHFLVNAWLWIDLSIFSVIPFVSMSFCSIVIIVNLMRLNQSYTNRLALNANPFTKHIYTRKLRNNMQISFMLISSNLYFLLTMCIFWAWFTQIENKRQETFRTNVKQTLVYTLLYSNNAFGILFYGLFSTKYRREVVRLFEQSSWCKRFKNRLKIERKTTIT